MKQRDPELAKGWVQIVHTLEIRTEGGVVAGNARKELEKKSGKKVLTRENYLKETQGKKLLN